MTNPLKSLIAPEPAGAGGEGVAQLLDEVRALRQEVAQLKRFLENAPGVRTAAVDPATALCVLADGPKLYVDSRDISIGAHLMTQGLWEPEFTREVKRLVRPDSNCIDAGANFGYYTMLMALLVHGRGRVLAFEPNPRLHALLTDSLMVNGLSQSGLVKLFQVALSDREGTARLTFQAGHSGGGSIMRDAPGTLDEVEVRTRTLDRCFEEQKLATDKPLFLKIDVEGAEYRVLMGAQNLLERVEDVTIMMEFTPDFIVRSLPVADFVDHLQRAHFRFFMTSSHGMVEKTPDQVLEAGNCYLFLGRRNLCA